MSDDFEVIRDVKEDDSVYSLEEEDDDELDKVEDVSQFGSYMELIKINKFNYKNPRRE